MNQGSSIANMHTLVARKWPNLLSQAYTIWVGSLNKLEVFSFLYFLKIKILKIYVRFEIFQKCPPVAPP